MSSAPSTNTVRDLFLAVLDEPPETRSAWLERACAGDEVLCRQVADLLQLHDEPDSLLDQTRIDLGRGLLTPCGDAPSACDLSLVEPAGTIIGRYELLEPIGQGGMGIVYRARQHEPIRRDVALKVIKPGMDSQAVIARFQAERQALALMDHPHITKVLDAGATEAGRPYFVVELVHGVPITTYCETCALTLRERLELFVPVCQALQHAHQRGIIHRDIKPSNVLIERRNDQPSPRIIDFGVAKAIGPQALTDQALTTGLSQLIGTPLYMSPEQAELSPLGVDARSDVYSLGVLLYELLTGTTPFEAERLRTASFDELRRIIQEEEPPRPSARISTLGDEAVTIAENRRTEPRRLARWLRGDLDWIVLKALEKDPHRRYQSAADLADDVQRFLASQPITARPPGLTQTLVKWTRRHAGLVTAGALLLLVSTLALIVSTLLISREQSQTAAALTQARDNFTEAQRQKQEAQRQQKQAEENFQWARKTVDTYLTKVSDDTLLNQPGMQTLRKDLLELALTYYQQFAEQRADDPGVREELAEAYARVGDIEREMGSWSEALAAYKEALGIRQQLADAAPGELAPQLELARGYTKLAAYYARIGQLNERLEPLDRAVQIVDRLQEQHGESAELILATAEVYQQQAVVEQDPVKQLELTQQARGLVKSLADADPAYLVDLADAERTLGDCRFKIASGALDDADKEPNYRDANGHFTNEVKIREQLVASSPTLENRFHLAISRLNLGATWGNLYSVLNLDESSRQQAMDALSNSVEHQERGIEVLEELAEQNPLVHDYSFSLALANKNVGTSKLTLAQETQNAALLDSALALAMRSSEICGRLMRDFPEVPENKRRRGIADDLCRFIALYAAGLADLSTESKQQFIEKAIAPLQGIPEEDRTAADWGHLGQLLYRAGDFEKSRAAIEKNIELRGEHEPTINFGPRWWYLTMLLARAGETDTAKRYFEKLTRETQVYRAAAYPYYQQAYREEAANLLGISLEGQPDDANPAELLEEALARDVKEVTVFANLGQRLRDAGQAEEARRAYAAAAAILLEIPNEERTPAHWGFLGQFLYRSEQYAEARRAFEKNLELRGESQPTISNGPRWWYLALLLARTGDTDKAREYYEQLVQDLETHPAPNLTVNEPFRAELAELLGIDDQPTAASEPPQEIPPPGSIPATPGQVADPAFDPQVTHPEYELGAGPRVLIDEGHRNMHTLGGRFAPFATLLERDGYRVAAHSGQFTPESLADVDVLVIANARAESPGPTEGESASAFTDEEMSCIHDWVAGGGSLLLVADHMPFGGDAARLAQRFDIEMTNGYAVGADRQTPTIFRAEGLPSHPITQGRNESERVEQVATFTGQAFRAGPDVQPLLVFGDGAFLMQPRRQRPGLSVNGPPSQQSVAGWLQGATVQVGAGRLAVFGEAGMFTAQLAGPERRPMGMNSPLAPQNKQFLLNVLHWLTPPKHDAN